MQSTRHGMRRRTLASTLLAASLTLGCSAPSAAIEVPATLAVVNGRVWTGDPAQPWAQAVAVRGDRIAMVGSDDAVRATIGADTRVVDARGGFVCPGFIDTHVHLLTGGFALSSVQLRDAATREDFVARIAAFARTVSAGTWIENGDWDHERWGGVLPTRQWIDAVTPDHPVWVRRLDGHMALANSKALALAGVTAATPDVAGGEIVRDASGVPTGILKDNAMALVAKVVPEPPAELQDRALDAAMRYLVSNGVTSVHDMADGGEEHLAVLGRARAQGRMRCRVYAAVGLASWARLRDRIAKDGRGDDWFRIGALKGFVDGSLGSHTAAFDAPFTDAPGDRGLLVIDPETLYELVAGADAAGLHVMVHAIGDRAIGTLLDVYARVAEANGPRDRRFRVEHAQHLRQADIARFAELGVIASMQPYHAIDDGRWAERVIGAFRARTTYAFRSLMDAGAVVAFGSDWFVAPPVPLEGIYAAVTRRTLDDAHPDGWVPEQKIDVERALRAYTVNAAWASFDEKVKGALVPGMLADLVVLGRDLTAIPARQIREVPVEFTIVAGQVVYAR